MQTQQGHRLDFDSSNPLSHQSVKFFCYLLFGFVVPLLIWFAARFESFEGRYLANTIIAAIIACLTSWYALNRLRLYAKARQLSYVVPVSLLTFGLSFGVLGILRVPFSVSLFSVCFIGTVTTAYVLTALTRLGNRPQYIVPGGHVSEIPARHNQVHVDSIESLEAIIAQDNMRGSVVGDLHHDHSPEWERLFAAAALNGIPVYHYRQIRELETGQVRIDRLSENVLGSLIPNLPYMALKRAIDVVSALLLLPILVPLMLVMALMIRLDSKGPALFIQERMGFRGEIFRMVKFRTMHLRTADDDSHADREASITRDDDARITRIGRYLRKVRLDELPQIWNIFKGEMSWIGPRPEATSLSEWYENEIPFYSYRHIVRPGLTGWAQVNQGHVTDLDDVTAKLRYDFYYVKNISHWLDMLIALKTIRVVLGGLGAK